MVAETLNEGTEVQRVPKMLHFIWVGGPIPDRYKDNITRWHQNNPDYTIHLWIDTDSTKPEQVEEAKREADELVLSVSGRLHNLGGGDATFLTDPMLKNGVFYQDEVTGQRANYAAASDILRLEILFRLGGVYVDTDTLSTDVPLGDIDAPEGFVKPKGPTNDVLCALPGAKMVDLCRDEITAAYARVLKQSDKQANVQFDMHRSSRPWKDRTTTTLEWSGPDVIIHAMKKFVSHLPREEADRVMGNLYPISIESKFKTVSEQTWRDKGPPSDLKGANEYFKEEFNFRFRAVCVQEIDKIVKNLGKNTQQEIIDVLEKLKGRIESTPEGVSVRDIIRSWWDGVEKDNPTISSKTKRLISSLSKNVENIETFLAERTFKSQNVVQKIQQTIFPEIGSYVYAKDSSFSLNVGMSDSIQGTEALWKVLRQYKGSTETKANKGEVGVSSLPKKRVLFLRTLFEQKVRKQEVIMAEPKKTEPNIDTKKGGSHSRHS